MAKRSWLFVPGDSESKLAKAPNVGADVVVVDLEASVPGDRKDAARDMALDWLRAQRNQSLNSPAQPRWVRINTVGTLWWRDDLAAAMQGAPGGIMIPKCESPEHLRSVSAELYELEQRNRIQNNATMIMPLLAETPAAALSLAAFADVAQPRLAGLAWSADNLAESIGASRTHDAAGEWTDTFRLVRAQVLLTAHACGLLAIDATFPDFRDPDALKQATEASRADGFSGMLAIHPAQVPAINAAFTPSAEELAEARAIVEAFAANPGAGAVNFNGKMVDRPHLDQAKWLLDVAA
jgi:citrate lyase subunit beta/citryl-CoA lyase